MNGVREVPPVASESPLDVFTRVVVPATRSRTKMSSQPFVSPLTTSGALELKPTYRPSSLTFGASFGVLVLGVVCEPPDVTLTRLSAEAAASKKKTSMSAFVSLETRLEALERNTTEPFEVTAGYEEEPLGWALPMMRF